MGANRGTGGPQGASPQHGPFKFEDGKWTHNGQTRMTGNMTSTSHTGYSTETQNDWLMDKLREEGMRRDPTSTDPTDRLNQAAEGISAAEEASALALQQGAAATGYGSGGGIQAGLQNLYQAFAGEKSDSSRNIMADVAREDAEAQAREDARMAQIMGLSSAHQLGLNQLTLARDEMEQAQEMARLQAMARAPQAGTARLQAQTTVPNQANYMGNITQPGSGGRFTGDKFSMARMSGGSINRPEHQAQLRGMSTPEYEANMQTVAGQHANKYAPQGTQLQRGFANKFGGPKIPQGNAVGSGFYK